MVNAQIGEVVYPKRMQTAVEVQINGQLDQPAREKCLQAYQRWQLGMC